jgi:S-adenosylmethionine hydrolase
VLAFFGTAGYLVIAMNRGNAAGLLGLGYNDRVRVEFE